MNEEISLLQWGLRFFGSEGGSLLTAEVTYRNRVVCRLSHRVGEMTPAESREVLVAQVLAWIADHQGREHSGDTAFDDMAV